MAEIEELEEFLTETETVEKLAGVVSVSVAVMIDGSAWRRSDSMVWPSDAPPSAVEVGRPWPSAVSCSCGSRRSVAPIKASFVGRIGRRKAGT
ncbi:unnamed protein product [Camellia sinensis]